ncbi:MAG: efflux transporter outer membrane subunit [Akkermansiaceae bacterium]|jgi:NodT family efflux transporter outer membrane factor (OMF) lipoprotein
MNRSRKIASLAVLALLHAACSKGPPVAEKPLALPTRFDSSIPPVPQIASSLRTLFSDPSLNHYLSQAAVTNPSLEAAAATLEESGFTTRQSSGALYPSISANGNGFRSQSNSAGQGFDVGTFDAQRFSATLDVQWELDLWGRVRAGVQASQQDLLVALAEFKTAHQSIAAQTAQAYFQLVAASCREALAQHRLNSLKSTHRLVDARFERGTGTLAEVSLAKTDVENARARLAELTNARHQASRLLGSITGGYPDRSHSAKNWPNLNRKIPAGIPSSLLRSRPDIDAAYQRIRAADSRIKVAHAGLFPTFSLTGNFGRQSADLVDLTSPSVRVWSIVGNLTAPLFQGGTLRAELGAANARGKAAVANYHSAVITALREVEDALGSETFLLQRENTTRSALAAARTAESRTLRSYESGISGILTLLEAQRRAFNTEETLIDIQELRYLNRVTLALALGKAY